MNKTKVWVTAATAVSAAGLAFTAAHEGFRAKPYKDVGGVPTIAYGNTKHPDGRAVKMTDAPVPKRRAAMYLQSHYYVQTQAFNNSLRGVKLNQQEYDIYADFAYNFGMGTWLKSSMRRELINGNYQAACKALLKYRYAAGRDCSVRSNGCYGVWSRQQERYRLCMEAQ